MTPVHYRPQPRTHAQLVALINHTRDTREQRKYVAEVAVNPAVLRRERLAAEAKMTLRPSK